MTYADALRPVEVLLQQIEQRVAAYVPREGTHLLLPEILMGPLALRLSRAAASYQHREVQFVDDAWGIFESQGHPSRNAAYFDERFDAAPDYTREGHEGRRLPRPFETIVETMRRLRDANSIRRQLDPINTSAILGGSASYGRFYNVRGGHSLDAEPRSSADDRPATSKVIEPSDLDFLIVLPVVDDIRAFLEHLSLVNFIDQAEVELAMDRLGHYLELDTDQPRLFSQKFTLWPETRVDPVADAIGSRQDYRLSLHIADRIAFDHIVHAGRPFDDDEVAYLYDYRIDQPSVGIARGFDGYHQEFVHKFDAVAGGVLVKVRAYDTIDGRFKPGLHQQLIMPQFDLRWDTSPLDLNLPLIEFKWKLVDRLRVERNRNPLRQQSLSLAHVRYHVFSPHVRRRTDDYEREY